MTEEIGQEEIVHSIKGFDQNLSCRGFQFEIGKTYEHDGPVIVCESGFHAISGYPLEVLDYYAPAGGRYAEVTQTGKLDRHEGDSKVASAKITIGVELHLHELIQHAVKWVFDRAKPEGDGSSATGYNGAASATGNRGAASATGKHAVAMSAGHEGRAMGAKGCALFLVYRDPNTGAIKHAWAGIVGKDGIKESTWYALDKSGKPAEIG